MSKKEDKGEAMKVFITPYYPTGAGGVNRIIRDIIQRSSHEFTSLEECDLVHLWGAGGISTDKPIVHTVCGVYCEEDADGFGDGLDLMPWSSMDLMNKQVVENSEKASVVTFDGKFLQDVYQEWGVHTGPQRLIPNAIEPWDFVEAAPSNKILFYGSGRKVKNPQVVIELAHLMPEYEFLMIGPGCDKATLRIKYGFHIPIPSNMTALGPVSKEDMIRLAPSIFLAVFPAMNDASSAAIREVMSMGILVVAADCAGHREVLEGLSLIDYLCPPIAEDFKDSIKDLENYGKKDYDIFRKACSNQIRDRFGIGSYVRNIDSVYEEFG